MCELYWLDLLKGLARIDQQIAQAWSRIMNEARTISRRAAEGQDTGAAERRLQTTEEMLALLERQRQDVLGRLERSGQSSAAPR